MKWRWLGAGIVGVLTFFGFVSVLPAAASPFGQGVFGANVPYGSATSLSINVGSDVTVPLSLSGGNFSGTGSHTVTVTSTDVVGYYLYVHATSTPNMVAPSGDTIPASANGSAAPLATNTWGYNTSGSTTNFLGMGLTSALLKDATGPFTSGDATTVTYGANTDTTQAAGTYTIAVTYTAVAKDQ
jgi:hypothetical protein